MGCYRYRAPILNSYYEFRKIPRTQQANGRAIRCEIVSLEGIIGSLVKGLLSTVYRSPVAVNFAVKLPKGKDKSNGAEGIRTPGLVNASHALCQLSYSPISMS